MSAEDKATEGLGQLTVSELSKCGIMGDAARKRKSYQEAIAYYEECLVHNPGNQYTLVGLADCCRSLKQFQTMDPPEADIDQIIKYDILPLIERTSN